MDLAFWFVMGGVLLITMTLGGSWLSRMPFSTSMLYLGVGLAFSPLGLGLAQLDARVHSVWLERLAEVVVLISLFTSGLKLTAGLHDRRWLVPLRLAVVSMLLTVLAIGAAGVWLLGLPWGAALLLGGILAPTDPVLASDVQVADPGDRDKLRFALTAEGGLNDGTAFPVVMLGLGLLGLHDIGAFGWRWLVVDVVWAIAGGVAIGAALGTGVGQLVLYLRRAHQQAVGFDNFLALGLIGLAYGAAVLLQAYGFLAVFAAGAALRRVEQRETAAAPGFDAQAEPAAAAQSAPPTDAQTDPKQASAYMAQAVLSFNEQLDRIGEVVAVIAIGLLLWAVPWQYASWLFVALVLLAIRPLSVALGLLGSRTSGLQRGLIGWFGIRGVGSMYYLMYAVNHGVPIELVHTLMVATVSVLVTSIIVHGISVTPLMAGYSGRRRDTRGGE